MTHVDLPKNLRLLCSYGKSTSDVCRRAKINRQQFDRYIQGQAQPSLPVLRRICDFFGVEDHEIFLSYQEFSALIKLRPPTLGRDVGSLEQKFQTAIQRRLINDTVMDAHVGYYHIYTRPEPHREHITRALGYIYRQGNNWWTKSIDRNLDKKYMLPKQAKYNGIVMETNDRLVIVDRELGGGGVWTYFLYCSGHETPAYLYGLAMYVESEGRHGFGSCPTIWNYLGKTPNLRAAIGQCGIVNPDDKNVSDVVWEYLDTDAGTNTLYHEI